MTDATISNEKTASIIPWRKGHRRGQSEPPASIKEGETLKYTFQPDGTVGLAPRETDFMDKVLGTRQIDINAMKKPLQPKEIDIPEIERRIDRCSMGDGEPLRLSMGQCRTNDTHTDMAE